VYVYIACPLFLSVTFGPQAQRNPNKETAFYESPTSWNELLNFPLLRQSAKWRNSQIAELQKLNDVQISCYFSFCKNRADLTLQVFSEQEVNGIEYWHLYLVEQRCIK
jgi:hypothetical protein